MDLMLTPTEISGIAFTGIAIWAFFDSNKSNVFKNERTREKEIFRDVDKIIARKKSVVQEVNIEPVVEIKKNITIVPQSVSKSSNSKNVLPFPSKKVETSISTPLRSPNEIMSSIGPKTDLTNKIYQDFVSISEDKKRWANQDKERAKKLEEETIKLKAQNKAKEAAKTKAEKPRDIASRRKYRFADVCNELESMGYIEAIDPEGTFSISRTASGEWFKCNRIGYHRGQKKFFNLKKMPHLKKLTDEINASDENFQKEGGRVFITKGRVYRMKNGVEISFKI